jgi:hypothetical protein
MKMEFAKRVAASAFAFAFLVLLSACATQAQTSTLVAVASKHSSAGFEDQTLNDVETRALANELAPFAVLAELVYRYDIRSAEDRVTKGCAYDRDVVGIRIPGWHRLDKELIAELDKRTGSKFAAVVNPCRSGKGLAYDTFMRLDASGKPMQAVIAFRGTENNLVEFFPDWWANLSQVDFGIGDNVQFRAARVEGGKLITALSAWLPRLAANDACKRSNPQGQQVPIELVGHSLGGSLAQHLAYASEPCQVLRTVTFDTSPVTGYFYLQRKEMIRTPEPDIERVYMNGEALAFVRKVTTRFTFPRERRIDYKLSFPGVSGNLGALHSMALLSTHLNLFASEPDPRLMVALGSSTSDPATGGGD